MKIALSFLLLLVGLGCGSHHDSYRALTVEGNQQAYALTGQGAGSCSALDKTTYLYRDNKAFALTWASCGKESWGDGTRAAQCINKAYPGLTAACAGCFGEFVGCSRANCLFSCMGNPDSESCKNCSLEHCMGGLSRCTGVPGHSMPTT
jgi:hypothetical protein